jgi:hypothetical protein
MARKPSKRGDAGPDEVVSLRLDARRRRAIARMAKARHTTPSEVIRSAVDALIDRVGESVTPYEGWSSVIGIFKDGPSDLSESTGRKFTAKLRARRRS